MHKIKPKKIGRSKRSVYFDQSDADTSKYLFFNQSGFTPVSQLVFISFHSTNIDRITIQARVGYKSSALQNTVEVFYLQATASTSTTSCIFTIGHQMSCHSNMARKTTTTVYDILLNRNNKPIPPHLFSNNDMIQQYHLLIVLPQSR